MSLLTINQIKRGIKRNFPKWLVDPIRRARGHYYNTLPQVTILESEHCRLNTGLPDDQFVFRPGLKINIDPRARTAFEHFCYRRLGMVWEFDFFLNIMKAKSAFLDIGANFGVFSLAFTQGRPAASALAVDPSPTALEILREHLKRNPDNHIQVADVAVGDREGTIQMRVNGFHLEAVTESEAAAEDVPTRVVTTDSLLAETGFVPDLVKIDVEGFELFVLRGAREFLSRNPVDILLEIHPERIEQIGYRISDITAELVALGYQFFVPTTELKPISAAGVEDQIHTNWVVCRKYAA